MRFFPRMVNGQYVRPSRQDNENIFLMYPDMPHFWYTKELIAKPTYSWEFVQLGNCGSPIETEAGRLVLTHGAGSMRKYAMGAFLLDRDDPARVIGRLAEPSVRAQRERARGVCAERRLQLRRALHGRELVIPYAMADYASTFATVPLDDVLNAMTKA